MTSPVVFAVGAGGAGTSMLQWSALKHLKQIRYAVLDHDAAALERSSIAHRIVMPKSPKVGSEPDVQAERHFAELRNSLAGVDICVVVAGLGGRAGCRGAVAVAEVARQLKIPCLCVGVLPARTESDARHARAVHSLEALGGECDVLFAMPLDRMAFDTVDHDDKALTTQDLYEHVDRVIDLACAPRPVNLVIRSASYRIRERASLGLYRRWLVSGDDEALVEELAGQIASDPWILAEQFNGATDVVVAVHSRERPSARVVADVVRSLSAELSPAAELDVIGRINPDCGSSTGVELISFCPMPPKLGQRMSAVAAAKSWLPLMPWLDRTLPPPMAAAHAGLFGARFITSALPTSVSATGSSGSIRGWLAHKFIPADPQAGFAADGFLGWLDAALTEVELAALRAMTRLTGALRRWRKGELRWGDARVRGIGAVRGAWRTRQGRLIWDRRAAALLVVVLASPLFLSRFAIANMQSMARGARVMSDNRIDLLEEFKQADRFRITVASKPAPATYGRYDTMGLAAVQPSAQTSHLDLWAVDQSYLGLHTFEAPVPPFAYVEANGGQARGQVGIVAQYLRKASPAPAKAMAALGLFPETSRLAELTGMSPSEAATELYAVFEPAGPGGELETVMDLAGCRTIQGALERHLEWKLDGGEEVELTDRHYLLKIALADPDACRKSLAQTLAASDLLSSFAQIAYVREEPSVPGRAAEVTYDIVIPTELASNPRLKGDLGLYLSGLRWFYLLDFGRARASFEELSRSRDPTAATLGAFLSARIIFWSHEFDRGSYRPDLFAPWRHLVGDPENADAGQNPGRAINREARGMVRSGDLPVCGAMRGEATHCRWSIRRQPTAERASPLPAAEAQRLRQALAEVESNPILNPGIVRNYLKPRHPVADQEGEAESEAEDGAEGNDVAAEVDADE